MRLLAAFLLFLATAGAAVPAGITHAQVRPGVTLQFPADHGAHPDHRTEWRCVTSRLKTTIVTGRRATARNAVLAVRED